MILAAAACTLTAVAAVVVLAAPLHSLSRRLLRPSVLRLAGRGVPAVIAAQRCRCRAMTALVVASSATVGWGFYALGFPAMIWLIDAKLGLQSLWLMYVSTWLGNGFKDLLSVPRPLELMERETRIKFSKNVQTIDKSYEKEYGAPSTHTMNSVCFNIFVLLELHRWQWLDPAWFHTHALCVGIWSLWMGFGRLYSFMHTPIDVYIGFCLGLALGHTWSLISPALLEYALTSRWAPAASFCFCVLTSALHPRPANKLTPCHDQVVSFAGVAFGAALALQYANSASLNRMTLVSSISTHGSWQSIQRVAVSSATMIAGYMISRPLSRRALLCAVYIILRFLPYRSQKSRRRKQAEAGQLMDFSRRRVETASRFLSYATVGFLSVWTPFGAWAQG